MTMVEKVARAIFFHMRPECDESDWADENRRSAFMDCAKHAIAAMREPTEEMFEAARKTPGMERVDAVVMNHFARTGVDTLRAVSADGSPLQQAWRAMIEEALR